MNQTSISLNPLASQDYYPFGMLMPGRQSNAGEYRHGFNGQEMDNEVSGTGNSYTAQFWQYDPRLGRRWNLDPKPNLEISQYSTFALNPIWYSDLFGDTVRNRHIADAQGKSIRGVSRLSAATQIGEYNVVPIYDSKNEYLIGYHAGRNDANGEYRVEYQLDVGDLRDFYDNIHIYTGAANLFYSFGVPEDGLIQMLAGDFIGGLETQWGEALTNLEFYEPSPRFFRKGFRFKGSTRSYNKYKSRNPLPPNSHAGQGRGSASKTYGQNYQNLKVRKAEEVVRSLNSTTESVYQIFNSMLNDKNESNGDED